MRYSELVSEKILSRLVLLTILFCSAGAHAAALQNARINLYSSFQPGDYLSAFSGLPAASGEFESQTAGVLQIPQLPVSAGSDGQAGVSDQKREFLFLSHLGSNTIDNVVSSIEPRTDSFIWHISDQQVSLVTDMSDIDVTPVPLPPAVVLFGSALVGFIAIARRRKQPEESRV